MRRFGEARRADIHYTRRPGAYGVILRGRGALLALNESPGEEFALPGGGIDPGESPVQALHREAMEETGYRIAVLRRVGAYQRYTYMPEYDLWAHKICHIYLCRAGRQVAAPLEPDHTPHWLPIETAADTLSLEGDRWLFRRAVGL
ncbi:MAG: NUDIX hydrolase [Pikeienuella sp.]